MKQLFAALVVGSVFSACGGGASSPSTPAAPSTPTAAVTSAFQGTIAGSGGQTGTVTVTVQAQVASSTSSFRLPFVATLYAQAATVAATGRLHLAGGSTIDLTGTFDSSTKALTLSGGGFTFSGVLSGGVISGSYTGPGGATGGFSSQSTAGGTVTSYCGTFGEGSLIGVFNLQVSANGSVSGVASQTISGSTQIQFFSGQVSGTTITLSTGGGSDKGIIQNGTVTGTTGKPWSGSTGACQ